MYRGILLNIFYTENYFIFTEKCEDNACQGGSCKIENHKPSCICSPGYNLVNNKCEDINECFANPCTLNAVCENTLGSFMCTCTNGTVLDTNTATCKVPGECTSDDDCSSETKCSNNHCINPCDKSTCGLNAVCFVVNHEPICECEQDSQGDPYKICAKFECVKDSDCPDEEACTNNICQNSCNLPRACGKNADCLSRNHIGFCSCSSGYTGDPVLGCVPIQYCSDNSRCSSGTRCIDNLCVGKL